MIRWILEDTAIAVLFMAAIAIVLVLREIKNIRRLRKWVGNPNSSIAQPRRRLPDVPMPEIPGLGTRELTAEDWAQGLAALMSTITMNNMCILLNDDGIRVMVAPRRFGTGGCAYIQALSDGTGWKVESK